MSARFIIGCLILAVGLEGCAATPTNDLARKLVGAWQLVSTEQRLVDGTRRPSPLYGPNGVGYLIYSDSGRMCAVLMDPDRPRWQSDDSPTEAELRGIADHFVSYCGRYEVNERDRSVVHHVELDVIPDNAGTDLKRYITLEGNTLKLRPAEPLAANVVEYTLTWRRVEGSTRKSRD